MPESTPSLAKPQDRVYLWSKALERGVDKGDTYPLMGMFGYYKILRTTIKGRPQSFIYGTQG